MWPDWNWAEVGKAIAPAIVSVGGLWITARYSAKSLREVTTFQSESAAANEEKRRHVELAEQRRKEWLDNLYSLAKEVERTYGAATNAAMLRQRVNIDPRAANLEVYKNAAYEAREHLSELEVLTLRINDQQLSSVVQRALNAWNDFMLRHQDANVLDIPASVVDLRMEIRSRIRILVNSQAGTPEVLV